VHGHRSRRVALSLVVSRGPLALRSTSASVGRARTRPQNTRVLVKQRTWTTKAEYAVLKYGCQAATAPFIAARCLRRHALSLFMTNPSSFSSRTAFRSSKIYTVSYQRSSLQFNIRRLINDLYVCPRQWKRGKWHKVYFSSATATLKIKFILRNIHKITSYF